MSNDHIAKVGARGQVVIPAGIRRLLDLQSGETVVFRVGDDQQVTIAAAVVVARRSRSLVKHYSDAEVAQILVDSAYSAEEMKDAERRIAGLGLDPAGFQHYEPPS